MQVTVNSANISIFKVGLEFDIYNRKATFQDLSTYSGSSGSGRFNVLGISFLLKDQAGITLATIDFADASKYIVPGSASEFEIDLSSLPYQFLFQTYLIQAAIKDANGSIYYTPEVYKKICQPSNMDDQGYVPGIFQVSANCPDSQLVIKDLTPYVYNNKSADLVTKTGTLNYPTGTISAVSFTGTPFANDVIYSGEYRVNCTSVASYDLEDDVTVMVTYLTANTFPITCTNKIADLICCMVELQTTYLKNCNTATGKAAQQKLNEVVLPFMLGLTKEINGQDASIEAALIRKTLNCNCGATSLRQNESNPINPSVTNIVLTGVGGTTVAAGPITGSTKTYAITSSVYRVSKGNTGDLAFTIDQDSSVTNVMNYKITFNYNTLASYVLTAIAGDQNLIAILNSLITATGGVSLSGLDGKCIVDLTTKNYLLTQNVNAGTQVSKINTASASYNVNISTSAPASIQTLLNGLGIGSFTVQLNGNVFSILSLANTFNLTSVEFTNPAATVPFQGTNVTLVNVLQEIIDYLCELTSAQMTLGTVVTLWLLDYNGIPYSTSFTAGQNQQAYNQGVANSIYNIVKWISNLTGLTCAKIKTIFVDAPNTAFDSNDRIYGTLGGSCAGLSGKQIAMLVINAINSNADVKASFCAIDCTVPGVCPDVSKVDVAMSGNNIGIYGVTWSQNPQATQTATVKYKNAAIDVWTTATNSLLISPNGNVQDNSPYLITGLTLGQTYDVQIINNCGGIGFVTQISVPTGTAYPATYSRDSVLYNLCSSSKVTLYTSAPFAVGVILYTNVGLSVPMTGYSYVSDSTGEIYTVNPATGQVLADTGSSCSNGSVVNVLLGSNTGTICSSLIKEKYVNGSFVPGTVLYNDVSLTDPVTGESYVVNTANGHIYNLNTVTGIIGSDTGLTCTSYSGTFARDNSEGTICGAATETLYSAIPFAVGVTMYTDIGLTTPATGYQYILQESIIYNMNAGTGVVGSLTGNAC